MVEVSKDGTSRLEHDLIDTGRGRRICPAETPGTGNPTTPRTRSASMTDLRLRGKAVLLAGATRGLGRAAAQLFAEEGASLTLIARDAAALNDVRIEVEARDGTAVVVAADLTDATQAAEALRAAAGAVGPFHAVVRALGRGFRDAFTELPDAVWREAFEVDILAPLRLVRLTLPHLPARRTRRAARCRIGQAAASRPGPSNAAKAALANLTRDLADELAPAGVAVNCVSPGRILTDRRRDRLLTEAQRAQIAPDAALAADVGGIRWVATVSQKRSRPSWCSWRLPAPRTSPGSRSTSTAG